MLADQLATPEDVASLLQRDDIDRSTAILLIECATAVVQTAVGQRIVEVVDDALTIDLDPGEHSLWLTLPERPVTAVSSVMINGLAVTNYAVQLRRSRLYRIYGWRPATFTFPYGPSTVDIVYTHGYPAGHQKLQPARGAVLGILAGVYGNPSGASSEAIDDYKVSYDALATRLEASPFLIENLRRAYGRPVSSTVLTTHR